MIADRNDSAPRLAKPVDLIPDGSLGQLRLEAEGCLIELTGVRRGDLPAFTPSAMQCGLPLREATTMARCDVCGNDYDKAFQLVQADGTRGTYDSFECAIHAVAPTCEHCGCHIIGHGAEHDGRFFCCAHCASHSGVKGIEDRV